MQKSRHSIFNSYFKNFKEKVTVIKLEGEFRKIEIKEIDQQGNKYAQVVVGAGCCIEHNPLDPCSTQYNSLQFLLNQKGYELPFVGRTNQTIGDCLSMGSAITSNNSDIIECLEEIEFVDGRGNLQKVNRSQDQFFAVGVSMGLFGVLTKVVLKAYPRYMIKGVEQLVDKKESFLNSPQAFKDTITANEYSHGILVSHSGIEMVKEFKGVKAPYDENEKKKSPFKSLIEKTLTSYLQIILLYVMEVLHKNEIPFLMKLASTFLEMILEKETNQFYDQSSIFMLSYDQILSEILLKIQFSEIWIPFDKSAEVLNKIQQISQKFSSKEEDYDFITALGNLSIEISYAKESPFWLSMSYGTKMIKINIYWWQQNPLGPMEKYFSTFWKELLSIEGARCHWDKQQPTAGCFYKNVQYGAQYLRKVYPKFDDWLQLRSKYDENQVFLTKYWRNLLGIAPIKTVQTVGSQYQEEEKNQKHTVQKKGKICCRLNQKSFVSHSVTSEFKHKYDFTNWGLTASAKLDQILFNPQKVQEIQDFVQQAKAKGKSIRCNGYSHSWSSIFGDSNNFQISLLSEFQLTDKSTFQSQIQNIEENELRFIKFLREDENNKGLIQIGASTLNANFLKWTNDQLASGAQKLWVIPFNVIMIEITFGGSNAPICHGSGINSTTLSDLVYALEYVDAHGNKQSLTASDEESKRLMKSASGCFGLLGVVTNLTLRTDPMTYANFETFKENVYEVIPIPQGYWDQINQRNKLKKILDQQKKKSNMSEQQIEQRFLHRCLKNYYNEFFWFPFAKKNYVNAWNNDAQKEQAVGQDLSSSVSEIQGFIKEFGTKTRETVFPFFINEVRWAQQFGRQAMTFLRPQKKVVQLMEAIHFRRGIQNFKALDMEVEIPIPYLEDGKTLDWSVVYKAWWDVVLLVYKLEEQGKAPMKATLEMRMVGAKSEVTLSPFKITENDKKSKIGAFCSIEVLTFANHFTNQEKKREYDQEWYKFCNEVFRMWCSYTDYQGNLLYPRPHFAKHWEFLIYVNPKVNNGQPLSIFDYLKKIVFKEEFKQFLQDLKTIGERAQIPFTLNDIKQRFANKTLKQLLFE